MGSLCAQIWAALDSGPSGTTLLQSNVGAYRNGGVASYDKATAGANGSKTWPNVGGSNYKEWHTLNLPIHPK